MDGTKHKSYHHLFWKTYVLTDCPVTNYKGKDIAGKRVSLGYISEKVAAKRESINPQHEERRSSAHASVEYPSALNLSRILINAFPSWFSPPPGNPSGGSSTFRPSPQNEYMNSTGAVLISNPRLSPSLLVQPVARRTVYIHPPTLCPRR